jgi:hypothetical protein
MNQTQFHFSNRLIIYSNARLSGQQLDRSTMATCVYCGVRDQRSRSETYASNRTIVREHLTPQKWIDTPRIHRYLTTLIPPIPLDTTTLVSICDRCFTSIRKRKYANKFKNLQIAVIIMIHAIRSDDHCFMEMHDVYQRLACVFAHDSVWSVVFE